MQFTIFVYFIYMVFCETSFVRFHKPKVNVHIVCTVDSTCCCGYFCSLCLACIRVIFILNTIFICCCWCIACRNFKFYCVFTVSKSLKFIVTSSICCCFLIGHVDSLKDNFYACKTFFTITLWTVFIIINPNLVSKTVCSVCYSYSIGIVYYNFVSPFPALVSQFW